MTSDDSRKPKKSPLDQAAPDPLLDSVSDGEYEALQSGTVHDPRTILGIQRMAQGVFIRAWHPDATRAQCLLEDKAIEMTPLRGGLFSCRVECEPTSVYRFRYHFPNGHKLDRVDPYQFQSQIGEIDLYLFAQGNHRNLWKVLGAHTRTLRGIDGTSFAIWAPNAKRVSVIGSFCGWDGRQFTMWSHGDSGVFEIFVPDVGPETLYKFEILTQGNDLRVKADPYGQYSEHPPETSSRVFRSTFQFDDEEWMEKRKHQEPRHEPFALYEVHLGSWRRDPACPERVLSYREIAAPLIEHAKDLGVTHLELLPLAEHAYYASWGYQVTGYYAPTSRYGNPDDLRWFINECHKADLGIILDWVPAHFPKDDHSLRMFDGTALYEHEDPRLGHHPDWGTLIFNYGRHEIRNFLTANALYWLKEFHIDGLRVDAVASMLYLDYSREEGQWRANQYGGRENIEAIEFLRDFNNVIAAEVPDAITIAEESTSWPGVTSPTSQGGLGFSFKWNMGWMHDTLGYFQKDPLYRVHHQNEITFSMMYEYSEAFLMPLSHDEVVHGKGSIYSKLPGDPWQKFANQRCLFFYQLTRPGKKLFFMGSEWGVEREWNHDQSLDWHLLEQPQRRALLSYCQDLMKFYRSSPTLWKNDHDPSGFRWIDCSDAKNSVMAYIRSTSSHHDVVVLNLTPSPVEPYRIGVPDAGRYALVFNSDKGDYGGANFAIAEHHDSNSSPCHGFAQSIVISLPPQAGIILTLRSDD